MTLPTGGDWPGVVGASGYFLPAWNTGSADVSSLPSGVSVATTMSEYQWQAPESSGYPAIALRNAANTEAAEGGWYGFGGETINITFTDAATWTITIYSVDYDSGGRAQAISDGTTSQSFTNPEMLDGAWGQWTETVTAEEEVTFTITLDGGPNTTIGGIFFDEGAAPVDDTGSFSDSVSFSDSMSRGVTDNRTLSESLTFGETIHEGSAWFGSLSESLSFTDSMGRSNSSSHAFTEPVGLSDVITRDAQISIADMAESLAFEDSMAIQIPGEFNESMGESLTFGDSMGETTHSAHSSTTLIGSLTFVDSMSGSTHLAHYTGSISESLSFGDSWSSHYTPAAQDIKAVSGSGFFCI